MEKEKSCGAVVYKTSGNEYFFLLEKMKLGHISIPKGHIEENETEEDTARREIKEETNLTVDFKTGFRHVISYSPRKGCIKDVVFFLAKVRNDCEMSPQESEVTGLMWKSFKEAKELLTFDSDKETLESAYNFLRASDS